MALTWKVWRIISPYEHRLVGIYKSKHEALGQAQKYANEHGYRCYVESKMPFEPWHYVEPQQVTI